MLSRCLNPRLVAIVSAAAIMLNLAIAQTAAAQWITPVSHAAAYLAAGLLCLEIARDYEHRLMRLSWILFSGEAFSLVAGFTIGTPLGAALLGPAGQAFTGLAFAEIGLLFLLAGMVVTWWQLRSFGLGFHAMPRDWAAVALILAGACAFFGISLTGGWMFPMMAEARLLLFLAAAVSVLLNRFCLQMGGGEIARVLRFLIAYVATRCVMNLLFAINKTYQPYLAWPELLLNLVFPWIFLCGIALRAHVEVRAAEELAQYQVSASR